MSDLREHKKEIAQKIFFIMTNAKLLNRSDKLDIVLVIRRMIDEKDIPENVVMKSMSTNEETNINLDIIAELDTIDSNYLINYIYKKSKARRDILCEQVK